MTAYLKEKSIKLDKEYFCGILKATGWVISGHTIKYACDMCSMHYHDTTNEGGHLDKLIMKKHVKIIVKNINKKFGAYVC